MLSGQKTGQVVSISGMEFKDKLAKLCEQKGWDQADLARAIHRETGVAIARTTVNAWFNGKGQPNLKSGLLIARTLGVSLDYLADDSIEVPKRTELSDEEQIIINIMRSGHANAFSILLGLFQQMKLNLDSTLDYRGDLRISGQTAADLADFERKSLDALVQGSNSLGGFAKSVGKVENLFLSKAINHLTAISKDERETDILLMHLDLEENGKWSGRLRRADAKNLAEVSDAPTSDAAFNELIRLRPDLFPEVRDPEKKDKADSKEQTLFERHRFRLASHRPTFEIWSCECDWNKIWTI